jgi:hydrogenase maturation factor HypE
MSFLEEIMDWYAERAGRMTAAINEKMTYSVTLPHFGNVMSFPSSQMSMGESAVATYNLEYISK